LRRSVIIRHSARVRHPLAQSEGGRLEWGARKRTTLDGAQQEDDFGRPRAGSRRYRQYFLQQLAGGATLVSSDTGWSSDHAGRPTAGGGSHRTSSRSTGTSGFSRGRTGSKTTGSAGSALCRPGTLRGLRVARQLLRSSDGRSHAMAFGPQRDPSGGHRGDHHAKETTEGHWTWYLAPLLREWHSFGSRCRSGQRNLWRLAALGTARKVVGR